METIIIQAAKISEKTRLTELSLKLKNGKTVSLDWKKALWGHSCASLTDLRSSMGEEITRTDLTNIQIAQPLFSEQAELLSIHTADGILLWKNPNRCAFKKAVKTALIC